MMRNTIWQNMYPLGELILLDRERCIQCARCIRFQDEIAGRGGAWLR